MCNANPSQSTTLDSSKVKWFRRKLTKWQHEHARHFPWRETNDPYKILVAEVLLQATVATRVAPVYQQFVERFPTLQDLSRASVNQIRALILPLGLLNRADVLSEIGRTLESVHDSEVPSDFATLRTLPRVGDYTAGAIQSFAFNKRAAIPDTNVIRLLRNFFGLPNTRKSHRGSPTKVDRVAAKDVLPKSSSRAFNYAMLDFGALVCTSKPKCPQCPISKKCTTASQ